MASPAASSESGSESKAPAPDFGLGTAMFVVVASMIGTGVLTTSGFTVVSVGSNQLMLWLWVVGGVIAVCGALSLAELAAALPESGGDYVFIFKAYGPLAGFLSGWVSFLIGFSAPIAVAAFALATYLLAPLGLDPATARLPHVGLATVAILVFAVIHVSGRDTTARVQRWITLLKLAVLVLFIGAGLASGQGRLANLADRPPLDRTTVVAMMFSLVYISYAYTGWNAAAYLAGEVRDAQRLLPRAILIGTALVTTVYLGLNLVYALALPAADLKAIAAKDGFDAVAPVAQLAAVRLFGPIAAKPLSVVIGLLMLSSLSAYVLTGPRILYAMALAGQFPAVAGRLTPRAQTPAVATAMQVGWALFLLWTGSFESILVYAAVGLSLFSMLTIGAVYVLRFRRPDLPRPFRTPGYPLTPALYLLGTSILTAAAFSERPTASLASLASILAGIPFFYAWAWLRPQPANAASRTEPLP